LGVLKLCEKADPSACSSCAMPDGSWQFVAVPAQRTTGLGY
jgi:hypothetical protein